MNVKNVMVTIQKYLDTEFDVEVQKPINQMLVPLYAQRKAGLGGRDYLFIYDTDELPGGLSVLQRIHEEDRRYVNAFYKTPKLMRLKVPNIITLFIKSDTFDSDIIEWVQKPTRSAIGGEIHSSCLIDLSDMKAYGQGISYTRVHTGGVAMTFSFKQVDPQNRAFYLLKELMGLLEQMM